MKLTRIAALAAVPAALLLAACGGGSSGIVGGGGGALGQQANVRFVNGVPGAAATNNYDIYFQSNGSASPSTPLLASVAYGVPSDYKILPTVAGNVIVQTAGGQAPSTGTGQLTSCPVPQFANNANYSIVIVRAAGTINCAIFQDLVYTGSGNQYRFHNASPSEAATVAFGTTTAPGVPGASTFAVQGTATFGQLSAGNSAAATYTQTTPTTLGTTSNVSFAVGPNSGATSTATNTLDASALTLPGSTTAPNATNTFTIPSGFAGASVYDITCNGTTTLPAGAHCVAGNALVGVFDSH